ncbi:hypothetical protein [Amphritea sp. HPY]|uniref:hypothetical protein n=1 Tax=Amphritea sp. HPY TaxID=3421652 RepID=UPI003D7D1BF0
MCTFSLSRRYRSILVYRENYLTLAFYMLLALAISLSSVFVHADTLSGSTSIVSLPASPVKLEVGNDLTLTSTTIAPEHSPSPPTTQSLISEGKVTFLLATDGSGNPVPANAVVDWVDLMPKKLAPDGSGQTSIDVDLDALGFVAGTTGGFRAHYVTGGGRDKVGTHFSDPIDITATNGNIDPLPDNAFTYSQGFYGSAPLGEAAVSLLIDEATCADILDALSGVSLPGSIYDCSDINVRHDLADFLVGEVGNVGGNKDGGFLPSGFSKNNLAAQTITLLLNLNLDMVLTGDAEAIHDTYFINIDKVQDIVGGVPDGIIDPVATTKPELGDCTIVNTTDCDADRALNDLGERVEALDESVVGSQPDGSTVGEILDAALALLMTGTSPQNVNNVELSSGDLTGIIGLINESFDPDPTGFVTACDYDALVCN